MIRGVHLRCSVVLPCLTCELRIVQHFPLKRGMRRSAAANGRGGWGHCRGIFTSQSSAYSAASASAAEGGGGIMKENDDDESLPAEGEGVRGDCMDARTSAGRWSKRYINI